MTTTNKAFIDAYGVGAAARRVRPVQSEELPDPFVATSEFVGATSHAGSESVTPNTDPSSEKLNNDAGSHRIDRPGNAQRRPLSQVRAEELFGVTSGKPLQCNPSWPGRCQDLITQAADQYDAVLQTLTSNTTGALIGVVGATPNSGCSTTAICLALRSAAWGATTALVEGNLARGGLAEALGVEDYPSWGSLLFSNQSVASAIISSADAGIDLVLSEPLPSKALDSTSRFRASLAAGTLRRKYQHVVVDLGCAGQLDSSLPADLAMAMGIDLLIATTTPATSVKDLTDAATAFLAHGLEINGVVRAE